MIETDTDAKSTAEKRPRDIRMAPDRPPLDHNELRVLPYALTAGTALILVLALVATIAS